MPKENVAIVYRAVDYASATISQINKQILATVSPARLAKTALKGMAVAVVALGASAKAAANFEASMLNVNTITRVGTLRLAEMSEQALTMGADLGKIHFRQCVFRYDPSAATFLAH